MCRFYARQGAGQRRTRGFSLVEILVTISLLSFIVLGLLMMFNQTQRAFRLSMNQVDVMEAGRLVTDMISREIEQSCVSKAEPLYNNSGVVVHQTTNMFIQYARRFSPPLLQGLPGSSVNGNPNLIESRTNIIQDFFFLTRRGPEWVGTGYFVVPDGGPHVGSLYRFTATSHPPFTTYNLAQWFRNDASIALDRALNNLAITNITIHRLADGVVHFRAQPYAITGQPLIPFTGTSNLVYRLPQPNIMYRPVENTYWRLTTQPNVVDTDFVYDAIPAQVELEIGFLEPNVLERYRGMSGNEPAQRNYLSNRVGSVHIFRQRIPIRNVDTLAYQ